MMRIYLLLLGCCTCLRAGTPIDSIFAPLTDSKSPGLAVLVRQNGVVAFERAYGARELHHFSKIDADTNFRLASCTKQFTAMAIMLLVHDGKLRYDTRLAEVFPEFPAYGRDITIRQLLTHTSGLPDYEDLMDQSWTPSHQIRDGEVLALLERQPHGKFAPGASWAYSNSGYVVLGLIVGKLSGNSFPQFLHGRIFKTLGMKHTIAYVRGVNAVANRAYGYSKEGGQWVQTDQSPTSATLGDGGVYSNLRDLARWDAALENHSLLSAEDMAAALEPTKLADGGQPLWPATPGEDNLYPGEPVSYGFGWFLDPYQGHARMWHYGSTMGFRTAIERFTEQRATVIVLCNRSDLDAGKLAEEVFRQLGIITKVRN
jgi:CubicO group peptidase (beta-lactamase class C family)